MGRHRAQPAPLGQVIGGGAGQMTKKLEYAKMSLKDGNYEVTRTFGTRGTGFWVQPITHGRIKGQKFFVSWDNIKEVLKALKYSGYIQEYMLGRKQKWEHVVRELYSACINIKFRKVGKETFLICEDKNLNIEEVLKTVQEHIKIDINIDNIKKARRLLKSNTLIPQA
jgi:hypothetical protein